MLLAFVLWATCDAYNPQWPMDDSSTNKKTCIKFLESDEELFALLCSPYTNINCSDQRITAFSLCTTIYDANKNILRASQVHSRKTGSNYQFTPSKTACALVIKDFVLKKPSLALWKFPDSADEDVQQYVARLQLPVVENGDPYPSLRLHRFLHPSLSPNTDHIIHSLFAEKRSKGLEIEGTISS
ncbi:hypothetical protein PILCRDRAFT_816784 [Piloderma croceum F 1598]|uniref:Uncharacterized protein n=1 Tax=Piloderma croceum (strain F 1598) TaxID=765440 RepID=A0A0C3G4J9_PILCF|nr:hypothetical protein PILCRDRAFT_816784 [Piloderma croceum F 1598]